MQLSNSRVDMGFNYDGNDSDKPVSYRGYGNTVFWKVSCIQSTNQGH